MKHCGDRYGYCREEECLCVCEDCSILYPYPDGMDGLESVGFGLEVRE